MTGEEAKTKWCPMVRLTNVSNRFSDGNGFQKDQLCLASNCMMWRIHLTFGMGEIDRDNGYCGLAGVGGAE
jgi:hypothetical protein